MVYVVINCLLYFVLLLSYRGEKNGVDFYKIIVTLYLITAVFCAINYAQNPIRYQTMDLIPFIYMFVVLVILFYPLRGFDQDKKKLALYDSQTMVVCAWIYVILAIIDTSYSFTDTVNRFQADEWGALRNRFYDDEESVMLYANQWQRLIKNLLSYTRPFAFVYAFYGLTKPAKKDRFLTILLLAFVIVPKFMASTVVASRGMVLQLAVELFFGYWMFKDYISRKRKRSLLTGALGLAVFFVFYSIIVSISRFGEDEAGQSVFSYFGHSMLAFANNMFYNMHDFAYGRRFFSWFIDAAGGNSTFDFAQAGSTHGTAFFTIVGGIFADWGHVYTVPVAIIACVLVRHFTKKKVLYFSDLIIIFFYINTLSTGIFVLGRGRALNWVMVFVMYFLVQSMERKIVKS